MTHLPSACPLDCPDSCSLTVEVENDRVLSVDGSEANTTTGGYICAKVRRFPEIMYGEERVLTPLVRTGSKGDGSFRESSWNEVLDLITRKLTETREQHGGEAILPFSYGGSNGLLSQDTTDARLFWRLGASRLARTVCAVATGRAAEGLYGKMPGVAYADYTQARLIIVWGANPVASGIHLVPYIQEAQKRGTKLVVIDPRRTKLAARADLHLAPRPGTDLPLALALGNWIFENGKADQEFLDAHAVGVEAYRERAGAWDLERAAAVCQVSREDLEQLATLYAESDPAVIRCGWGLERNRNGGSAVAAVLALPGVAGKFGVRGGGYTLSNSAAWRFDHERAANEHPPDTRTVNMNLLGKTLTREQNPPVKFLFVYNCNPVATMPNQEEVRKGMEREDLFTVVFDSFRTDTARYADVVLPAATFLERREMPRGYGSYVLHDAGAVVGRVGESRTNHEVFRDLCRRLDLEKSDDPRTEAEVRKALLGPYDDSGVVESLDADHLAHPEFGEAPVQFADVFPRTGDGKIHLFPGELDDEAPHGLYTYQPDPATANHPLALVSPSSSRTINSMLGQLHKEQVPVRMNPVDASERNLDDGGVVRMFNDLGEVRCRLAVDSGIRPGVVEIPKGLWSHNTYSGTTANALSPDTLTDLGQGACFNDARVEVVADRA